MITEGKAKVDIEPPEEISKRLEVFYNPVMHINRDISVALLNSLGRKGMRIADPLAGSGIRSIRFSLEVEGEHEIAANDLNPKATELMKGSISTNNARGIKIFSQEANRFLYDQGPFDYIDIDPFGPPNPFLGAAMRNIRRGGIVAVTATDTSALSGTYPKAAMRKYWARALRNELMHETGLRILTRKVQLVASQFNVSAVPIYSYAESHYMRIFFRTDQGKSKAADVVKQHGYLLHCPKCLFRKTSKGPFNEQECENCSSKMDYAGPMWLGDLWDKELSVKVNDRSAAFPFDTLRITGLVKEESQVGTPFFYDIHSFWKVNSVKVQKRIQDILSAIKERGFASSRTHLSRYGIRTNAPYKVVSSVIMK